jgi:hypothetical protein
MPMMSAGPTIGACLGEPVPGSVIWKAVHRVESVSEGARTRLRDLTFGSINSLGPLSVFRSPWSWARGRGFRRSSRTVSRPAMLVQGMRATLSTFPSSESVLQRSLSPRSGTLASASVEPNLAGKRVGEGTSPRAVPAVSAADSIDRPHRARAGSIGVIGPGPGPDADADAGVRFSRHRRRRRLRGPAPSDNS